MFDSDLRSPFTRNMNTSHTGHILPEIIDVCFLVHFAERDGGENLYITDGMYLLGSDIGRGYTPIGYSAPLGIIEFRSAPSFLLQTCIVVLASIDTIKSDCTRRCPPTEIGGNSLHASIGVGNAQVQTESGTVAPRGTVEVPHCFGLMVIPAVTQKYANSVVTIL